MAAQENGSEQQLESGKDVFFHHPLQHFLSVIYSILVLGIMKLKAGDSKSKTSSSIYYF